MRRRAWHRENKRSNVLPVRKGEIYQFDFGKNYIPEISYEHRGMVIGVRKKLLHVLPIFSYLSKHQSEFFHPVGFRKLAAGGAQPNISRGKIIQYFISLPPIAEQRRIVARLEELLPLVDELGEMETELSEL